MPGLPPPHEPVDRALILVKAVPNPSKTHGETVCCAGVTLTREWRRIYPVRFRQLAEGRQFVRWQWLDFRYGRPKDDTRKESRRAFEDTLRPGPIMPEDERADFLAPLVRRSCAEAAARGESLALVRPLQTRFYWRRRSAAEVEKERAAFARAARQASFLDAELAEYDPPPFEFRMRVTDAAGPHDYECGDWETAAAFFNLRRQGYSEQRVLQHLDEQYNSERPRRGLLLAMGTVKKRPDQWLLLGILSLPDPAQHALPV